MSNTRTSSSQHLLQIHDAPKVEEVLGLEAKKDLHYWAAAITVFFQFWQVWIEVHVY
jgi:hypothetical protein